ncbi:MAG: hypothetical protein ACHP78_03890 [Terriglobales bacterium]
MTDAGKKLEALAQRIRALEETLRRDKHGDHAAYRRELAAIQDQYDQLEFVVRDRKPRLTLRQLNQRHREFWKKETIQ